jgi:hypothetical protein
MKKLTTLLLGFALLGGATTAKADSVTLRSEQMDRVTAGHLNGFYNGKRHLGWYWRWYDNSWHKVFGFHIYPYYWGKTGLQFGFKKTPTAPDLPPPRR